MEFQVALMFLFCSMCHANICGEKKTGLAFWGQRHAYWQDQQEMHTTPNTEQPLAYKTYRAPLSVKECLLLVLLLHFCQWWARSFIIGPIPRLIPVDGKSTTMTEDLV